MKLRNKKTGEIIIPTDYTFASYDDGIKYKHHIYYSLAELNEEWEDYVPQEPLIKDEKIRKAVLAWAEANNIIEVIYDAEWNAFRLDGFTCNFDYDFDRHDELLNACHYTITELCGEDE